MEDIRAFLKSQPRLIRYATDDFLENLSTEFGIEELSDFDDRSYEEFMQLGFKFGHARLLQKILGSAHPRRHRSPFHTSVQWSQRHLPIMLKEPAVTRSEAAPFSSRPAVLNLRNSITNAVLSGVPTTTDRTVISV